MANDEQLTYLKHGVDYWNIWRQRNPTLVPDLRYADLRKVDLRFADLHQADLYQADISDAYLNFANLSNATLSSAKVSHTILSDADLSHAILSGADFTRSILSETRFNFADLSSACLTFADLSNAILCDTRLNGADLSGTDLSHADLSHATLSGTNLSYANLSFMNLNNACVGYTSFINVDLGNTKGLETLQHLGPSIIDIDTIYRSAGQIPEAFLRGAGVPDQFVIYMHSLAQQPIQYYTCFISFSIANQSFVERLYTDLQAKGVRCWYFPEDVKIGDKIHESIDESIRMYDKLLLVLSEASVNSEWVEREVDIALAKEKNTRKQVLFPLRLDDSITTATRYWARSLRENRHIGDFTQWKDFDFYQRTFQRVLRDLQPPAATTT